VIDLAKASEFMATHARLIERRRFDLLFGDGDGDAVIAALAAYANVDGGFGWGLEPDLRDRGSQPVGALHAFEALADLAAPATTIATTLCDWLESVAFPGGGLPFALPGADGPGSGPWWAQADQSRPSLHITSAVCELAHRVADRDPAVARHPWLARATDWCLTEVAALERPRGTLELRYVLQLLDVLTDTSADAARELRRLAAFIPSSGTMPVEGGAEDESMRPLDFSPLPDRPLREHIAPAALADDLDRIAAGQRADGGWDVEWTPLSPAAALEWRGHATVRALQILEANGRLDTN
jgi:hypothetical protein